MKLLYFIQQLRYSPVSRSDLTSCLYFGVDVIVFYFICYVMLDDSGV